MDAASVIPTPHRAATMRTLIGLLAVTGMRIGEAIRLDRADIDSGHGTLIVRDGKFGKSRELPLHATHDRGAARLPGRATGPSRRADRGGVHLGGRDAAVLLQRAPGVQADRRATPASCRARRPAGHGRMTCATRSRSTRCLTPTATGMATSRRGSPLLSTYLGHVNPGSTYWYLQAAPELLALAGRATRAPPRGGAR